MKQDLRKTYYVLISGLLPIIREQIFEFKFEYSRSEINEYQMQEDRVIIVVQFEHLTQ